MDVEALIKAITIEVLKQVGQGPKTPDALIVGDPACPKCQKAVKALGRGAEVIYPDAAPAADEEIRRIVPYLSIRHMADLAQARPEGELMELVFAALLAGQPVEVMEYEYRRYADVAPEGLLQLFEEQEAKLASFGMTAMDLSRRNTVRIRKALVTDSDMAEANQRGAQEVLLPLGAQVTPLAVERARDLGITITRG